MHKNLEAQLRQLAQSILLMKSDTAEIDILKEKAAELYEKLSVLSYLDKEKYQKPTLDLSVGQTTKSPIQETVKEQIDIYHEEQDEELFEPKFDSVRIDIESLKKNQVSSKEEFRDAISADKTATLFDSLEKATAERRTINDKFLKSNIQIGLNDRLAFVKHLFNNDQTDFNDVLNQLNSFNTEQEAKKYIIQAVKSKYDWSGKEEYEERLLSIIERKFS